ncbi:transposase domain-containing protein [Orbaceae bacterium ESL0721]|nr:transposase domain-containing protein [Orbaceae bacterium ESL0721]
MWVTAQDLIQVQGMPKTTQGVTKKAKAEQWERRKAVGIKGGAYEYNIFSFSALDQAYVLKKLNKVAVGEKLIDRPAKPLGYSSEHLWRNYDSANEKQKAKAAFKAEVVTAAKLLADQGVAMRDIFEIIPKSYSCTPYQVRRWYYEVDPSKTDPADYVAKALEKHAYRDSKNRYFAMTPAAWDFFCADFLRLERPAFNSCYLRLSEAAKQYGWSIPSRSSLRRKLDKTVPKPQQLLLRQGEHALMRLYPAQQRTIEGIGAMEWINGDGYLHNVFVKWYNGEVLRPKTWIWQDIYSRKILSYYCDISENSDAIRLSLADLIKNYGIPKDLTIDNTRAAANKWLTGGVPSRYRFKVKPDDPKGIIPMLGIRLHWSSVQYGRGHGQAKPIERAFSHGGLGELVDKHPLLAGAYTGSSVQDKPDNYNPKNAVDVAVFMQALKEGIDAFNRKPERDTEACRKQLSFDEAFNANYATTVIQKATIEQQRLLLLHSEAVRVKADGTFVLEAGGSIMGAKNRYYSEKLMNISPNKVVIKFDPRHLHEKVAVYQLNGAFICEAVCLNPVAFGDTQTARAHRRQRTQFVKHHKAAAENQKNMDLLTLGELVTGSHEDLEMRAVAKVIKPFTPTQVKEQSEEFDFDAAFEQGLARLKAANEGGF